MEKTIEDRKEEIIHRLRFCGRSIEGVVFGGGRGLKDVGSLGDEFICLVVEVRQNLCEVPL